MVNDEPMAAGRSADSSGSLQIAFQIDSVCDAFEASWKAGSRPDLSQYLAGTEIPQQTLFAELVLIDIAYRAKRGERPSIEEYGERFPSLRHALTGLALPQESEVEQTVTLTAPMLPLLGKFQLVEKLGEGAHGVVWKARDVQLQRWVALKQFREKSSTTSRRLLRREALAVAQVNHPNVVRVHEIGKAGEKDYVAFEYVGGGSLSQWLKRQPAEQGRIRIPPQQAARMAMQLASGLQAVHEKGVVHRDFKPGNILLDEDDTPKIADFGLARQEELLTTIGGDGVLMGTLPYMSPEQCRGRNIGPRCDIYALGVVLYEMLTGQRPIRGSREELLQRIPVEKPIPPGQLAPGLPKSLENICLRALEKIPSDRYQTAAAMQVDLEKFLNGDDVPRVRPPLLTRMKRGAQRYWTVGLAVFAVGTILGALAFSSLQQPDDGKRLVSLRSVPEGAKVAFIPLDKWTGEPHPEQIIHAQGTTPVWEWLPPGDYLVEVYFNEDGTGGFHEVYRHVPEPGALMFGYGAHTFFKVDKNDPNHISWGRVEIPAESISQNMALVDGSNAFAAGIEGSSMEPAHRRSIRPFFIDPHELSLGEYDSKNGDDSFVRLDQRTKIPADSKSAVAVTWDDAVFQAEMAGKRLPDQFEYEFAATRGGTQRFSWGNDMAPESGIENFGPVGTPGFDRVEFNKPVFGLCSNLAEWTMSSARTFYPAMDQLKTNRYIEGASSENRIFRGGNYGTLVGDASVTAGSRDPRRRFVAARGTNQPGLGCRFVRSIRPRLSPDDFGRPISE
jgi:serine/threonine protein kinase/formylglycine-generating enzyme required for sulfatase activity